MELVVVLGIIALVGLVIGRSLSSLRNSDLSSDANQLGQALRLAYDRALATSVHHRVLLSVGSGDYVVERCEGSVLMRRTRDESAKDAQRDVEEQLAKIQEQMQHSGIEQSGATEALAQAAQKLGNAVCQPIKDKYGKPRRLRKQIRFDKVYVAHLEEPVDFKRVSDARRRAAKESSDAAEVVESVDEGIVAINFFASGRGEKAVVKLASDRADKDEVVSLLVYPLSGRVKLHSGDYRGADKFVGEDAEGNKVPE